MNSDAISYLSSNGVTSRALFPPTKLIFAFELRHLTSPFQIVFTLSSVKPDRVPEGHVTITEEAPVTLTIYVLCLLFRDWS